MKLTSLLALAGGASMVAAGSAQAFSSIGYVLQQSEDPTLPGYVNHWFLDENHLQSAIIRLEGIEQGETIQGFIGTPMNPWNISTTSADGFFNISGILGVASGSFDGESFYAAFDAPYNQVLFMLFDSGLLGNPFLWGDPIGDPESGLCGFAQYSDGSSDENIFPASWLVESPEGFDPPSETYSFLRLTWSAFESVDVNLVLAMNTPAGEIPLSLHIPAVPAPGALGLLGLAGLVGTRRRRN